MHTRSSMRKTDTRGPDYNLTGPAKDAAVPGSAWSVPSRNRWIPWPRRDLWMKDIVLPEGSRSGCGAKRRSTEAAIPNVGTDTGYSSLDRSQPPFVLAVPIDCFLQAVRERLVRCPPETALRFRPVDRVSANVARPVGDPLDQRLGLVEFSEDALPDRKGGVLLRCAEVEHLPLDARRIEQQVQRGTVVLHVNPVPRVRPGAIEGQRLVLDRVRDEERDELLRVLVRAVVVRTPRNHRGEPVRGVVGEDEAI